MLHLARTSFSPGRSEFATEVVAEESGESTMEVVAAFLLEARLFLQKHHGMEKHAWIETTPIYY